MTYDVIVIGAGQAGLAMGYHLSRTGKDFLLVDADPEIGLSWRRRWDSMRLFTSARRSALPGLPFPGAGGRYPGKDEVADYLGRYAERFDLPVQLGVRVKRLSRTSEGFEVEAEGRTYGARQVVVATGPFQRPAIPAIPLDIPSLHTAEYRNPERLPEGPVVIVGGGNSGVQIAEELAATRPVTLALGRARPSIPQRLLGRDVFDWLSLSGLVEAPAESRIGRRMQQNDPLIGGSPRRLWKRGVRLVDRIVAGEGSRLRTASFDEVAAAVVIWATGFRPDYDWLDVPGALSDDGRPEHRQGHSPVPGLYHLGLPFLRSRGSALIGWVGKDAAHLRDALMS